MTSRKGCRDCSVRLTGLCGEVPESAAVALSRIGHRRRMRKGALIYSSQQPFSWYALIVSGVIKLVNTRPDGRHHIAGMQFSPDFVGNPCAAAATLSAEAATDIELCCFSGPAFQALAKQHPEIERSLLASSMRSLDAAHEWMFVLAKKPAVERVATLLALFAGHADRKNAAHASRPLHFELPLSRVEMADCLGLSIETISRQLSILKAQGLIDTSGKSGVTVMDWPALQQHVEVLATQPA